MKRVAPILLLWGVLVLPGLLSRGYWAPDEPRYGAVAREVWKGDGALVPHLNGEVYGEKPPLFFWLVAGCQKLTGGLSAAASRIPSALSVLVAALLLMGLVRRTHGEREAGVAAAIFLTSALVVQMGQWVAIDSLVTCLVVGCLYLQERARGAGGRRWAFTGGIYVLLAAIILSKGAPVFVAVASLAGAAWLRGGPRALFPRHLLWGVPLLALLVASWVVPAAREAGWGYIRGLSLDQVSRRLVDADSHQRPLWYYLLRFPVLFLPWAILLPAAVAQSVRDWRAGGEDRMSTGRYVLWFAVPFLLFSLISGKRSQYVLPLYPAAAALCAVAVVRLGDRRLVRIPLMAILVTLILVGPILAASPFLFDRIFDHTDVALPSDQFAEVLNVIRGGSAILLAVGGCGALIALDGLLRRRQGLMVAICVAAGCLALGVGLVGLAAHDVNKSYDHLAQKIGESGHRAEPLVLVGLRPAPYCITLDRHDFVVLRGERQSREALEKAKEGPGTVFISKVSVYRSLRDELGAGQSALRLRPLAFRQVGHRRIVAFRCIAKFH